MLISVIILERLLYHHQQILHRFSFDICWEEEIIFIYGMERMCVTDTQLDDDSACPPWKIVQCTLCKLPKTWKMCVMLLLTAMRIQIKYIKIAHHLMPSGEILSESH